MDISATNAPAKTPRRPSRLRADKARLKRVALLLAAMRCVRRSGLQATTMEDVAKEAGVTRVTIYREFGSRSDMMRSIAEYRFEAFNRRFANTVSMDGELGTLLEAYLVASVRIALHNPTTRQVVQGRLDFTKPGSRLHGLTVEMWRDPLARARVGGTLGPTIDDDSAAQWILLNQVSLSRLSVDADLGENQARDIVRNFILPAFSRQKTGSE